MSNPSPDQVEAAREWLKRSSPADHHSFEAVAALLCSRESVLEKQVAALREALENAAVAIAYVHECAYCDTSEGTHQSDCRYALVLSDTAGAAKQFVERIRQETVEACARVADNAEVIEFAKTNDRNAGSLTANRIAATIRKGDGREAVMWANASIATNNAQYR